MLEVSNREVIAFFSVKVAADEMLSRIISIRSHNFCTCGVSSPYFSQTIYLPAVLLNILQDSVMVELILDFKNWIGINPMQLQ